MALSTASACRSGATACHRSRGRSAISEPTLCVYVRRADLPPNTKPLSQRGDRPYLRRLGHWGRACNRGRPVPPRVGGSSPTPSLRRRNAFRIGREEERARPGPLWAPGRTEDRA
jgi:hypothetical protein